MATLIAIGTGIYLDERVWGEELEQFSLDQLQSAYMLVFGRVTYEGMTARHFGLPHSSLQEQWVA